MQRTLFIKLSIIAGICLLLAIGLSMIDTLITERQNYAQTVQSEIAEQHVGEQVITTPFIISRSTSASLTNPNSPNAVGCQPANLSITPPTATASGIAASSTTIPSNASSTSDDGQLPMPSTHNATANVPHATTDNTACNQRTTTTPYFATQTLVEQALTVSDDAYSRSVYAITSYKGDIHISQQYQLPSPSVTGQPNSNQPSATANANVASPADEMVLIIPVSDIRGVADLPTVTINGKTVTANFAKTNRLGMDDYIEVPLSQSVMAQAKPQDKLQAKLQVDIKMPLLGLSRMRLEPLGDNVILKTQANWSSPLFIGTALPVDKNIDASGFHATWQNQSIANKNTHILSDCLQQSSKQSPQQPSNQCHLQSTYETLQTAQLNTHRNEQGDRNYQALLASFGVDFAKPNDIYHQTERALKYGLLIVFISFGSFFLFEVTKSLRIHPIQYVLVGAALVVFYMLLLPLAEQVLFWQAYLIAAIACVSLISWYAFYVLHQWDRAAVFGVILSSQYVAFYLLLTLDGLNLLIGAVMCFVLIAVVMYLTRHVDWYNVA